MILVCLKRFPTKSLKIFLVLKQVVTAAGSFDVTTTVLTILKIRNGYDTFLYSAV